MARLRCSCDMQMQLAMVAITEVYFSGKGTRVKCIDLHALLEF